MNEKELRFEIDHFCEDCPHCEDCGGWDDGYGAPMYVEEVTCQADFNPENKACPRYEEFADLTMNYDELVGSDDDE